MARDFVAYPTIKEAQAMVTQEEIAIILSAPPNPMQDLREVVATVIVVYKAPYGWYEPTNRTGWYTLWDGV